MNEGEISRQSPFSLFQQCLNFVADNIEIVDSFSGFPSQVGQQIFKLCLAKKKFMDQNLIALTLFTSEFGDEVLSSLNLSGQYLCLNYYLEQFLLFTSLRELDVSYCGLGDDHEILAQFTQLNSLEVMSLQGNSLSNAGIQRMTTPYRMLGKGPGYLRLLDISGNLKVSMKVLKYLSPFKCLTVVLSDVFHEKSSEHICWDFKTDESWEACSIETRGWACDIIEEWKIKVKSKKSSNIKKKTFYSKPQQLPSYKTEYKRKDIKIVIAINKTADIQKQLSDVPQVVPKEEHSEDDKQALFALYGYTLPNNTDNTINSQSCLDLMVRNDSSCKDSFQAIHYNSHNKSSRTLKKISHVTYRYDFKANQLTKNSDSKTNKEKQKENLESITQYLISNTSPMKGDEKLLLQKSISKTVLNQACFDVPSDVNNSVTICKNFVGEKTYKLCKSMNSESVKDSLDERQKRKRKRIVISKPLSRDITGEMAEDKESQSKYQKLELNGSKQTSYSNSEIKQSSLLDCLNYY